MPNYKLLYFNLRGRAEPIRWIFAVANEPYEDERLDRDKEWPVKKKVVPYGKIPLLYVDGKAIGQSVAICRYLGRQFNLYPEDEWMASIGDEIADAVHDLVPGVAKIIFAKNSGNHEEAKKMLKEFNEVSLKSTLSALEAKLTDHKWYCGEKMTWVDIFAACYLSQLSFHNDEAFGTYPLVKKHFESIVALSQIQAWIKERPETSH